jgi:hypothetical protein
MNDEDVKDDVDDEVYEENQDGEGESPGRCG